MNNLTTIPEQEFNRTINAFYIDVENKTIKVFVKNETENNREVDDNIPVSLSSIWLLMNTTQKAIVKGFFKALAAQALEVDSTTIIGDFTDEI